MGFSPRAIFQQCVIFANNKIDPIFFKFIFFSRNSFAALRQIIFTIHNTQCLPFSRSCNNLTIYCFHPFFNHFYIQTQQNYFNTYLSITFWNILIKKHDDFFFPVSFSYFVYLLSKYLHQIWCNNSNKKKTQSGSKKARKKNYTENHFCFY